MADSLRSAAPVSGLGGFAGRREPPAAGGGGQKAPPPPARPPEHDQIEVAGSAAVARKVLRERVLARTRNELELGGDFLVPVFAEVIDDESTAAFLGRLLSAQNQLAAGRAGRWPGAKVRASLDRGLRGGAEEALELLGVDGRGDAAAVAVIAAVMAEYGQRLAALLPPSA